MVVKKGNFERLKISLKQGLKMTKETKSERLERKLSYLGEYPSRTMCDVLREMRECCKTSNYSYLPGLIEEVQSMGNRMEAALESNKELRDIKELKKEVEIEVEKLKKLEEKHGKK